MFVDKLWNFTFFSVSTASLPVEWGHVPVCILYAQTQHTLLPIH